MIGVRQRAAEDHPPAPQRVVIPEALFWGMVVLEAAVLVLVLALLVC